VNYRAVNPFTEKYGFGSSFYCCRRDHLLKRYTRTPISKSARTPKPATPAIRRVLTGALGVGVGGKTVAVGATEGVGVGVSVGVGVRVGVGVGVGEVVGVGGGGVEAVRFSIKFPPVAQDPVCFAG
jgi:hypothetical protein